MTNCLDFYRCDICGNIVQVLHSGEGDLVCCGQPMIYLQPQTTADEKKEKHVPIFINENLVQVGTELHPMIKEHHIEFIEAVSPDRKNIQIKFLDIEQLPQMNLNQVEYNKLFEYCNLHGLWIGGE